MNARTDSESDDDTFAGRGQDEQDVRDLLHNIPPSEVRSEKPGSSTPTWPVPESANPVGPIGKPYTVMCDDNFHFGAQDGATDELASCTTIEEALARCRLEVDRDLLANHSPGMTADDLYDKYTDFGPAPWIRGPGLPPVPFSAWDYAKARATEICVRTNRDYPNDSSTDH